MTWLDILDNKNNPAMLRQQISLHLREAQKASWQVGQILTQLAGTAQPGQVPQFQQLQQLNSRLGTLLDQVQGQLDPPR